MGLRFSRQGEKVFARVNAGHAIHRIDQQKAVGLKVTSAHYWQKSFLFAKFH